jgi:hypothetical protein
MNLSFVVRIGERLNGWAVIGAYALAARGYVRQTADIDLMTADFGALDESLWTDLRDEGARVEVRKGDFDDPLAGVVRIQSDDNSIDVVVVRARWQKEVIDRAEAMPFGISMLNVVRASDLILLKLFAGGYGDLHDIHRLLDNPSRADLISQVNQSLVELSEEMRQRWQQLLSEGERSS